MDRRLMMHNNPRIYSNKRPNFIPPPPIPIQYVKPSPKI